MKLYLTSICLVFSLLFMGCSSSDDANKPISAIKIDEKLSLHIGGTKKLVVSTVPEKSNEDAVFIWESSDTNVVEVKDGELTAKAEGTATITVQLQRDEKIFSECELTVTHEYEDLDLEHVIVFEDNKLASFMMYYDTDQDGKLQVREALLIKELNMQGNGIASLKGLEYLRNLEVLDCSKNSLREVDFSKNLKLKSLKLKNNQVDELDVTMLAALEVLNASSNRLFEIDVTQNSILKEFRVALNNGGMSEHVGITKIDISQNPVLEILDVNYINISELDLSKNPKLKWIDFGLSTYTNRDLEPITEIDFSNNLELEYISFEGRYVLVDINGNFIEDRKGVTDLDVSMLPNLKYLDCQGNNIFDLDLSKNPNLNFLSCGRNKLTKLDITKNPKIDTLVVERNKLTELDLTKSTELVYINCQHNEINGLDISKTKMSYMLANDNEMTFLNLGDKVFDTLGGSPSNVGGEKRPYLYMKLNNNQLSELDVSKQEHLAWLEINDNKLKSLDLGVANPGGLLCKNNELAELKLDNATRMWELDFSGNKLTGSMDLSKQTNLSRISTEDNALTEVQVWESFNQDCTYFLADHTTGINGTFPCYTKDSKTKWVKN